MAAVTTRVAAAALILAWLIGTLGCAQAGRPTVIDRSPVFSERPDSYRVQRGDTLYSIAWRYGLDYRQLARHNDIRAPYTIRQGQQLRLVAPPRRSSAAPPAPKPAAPKPPLRGAAEPAPGRYAGAWRWPTDAPVIRRYGRGNKGVDYRLEPGFAVRAAAPGQVVYAGSGLGGFRHLVIIKHDANFLSAYSLNRPIRVAEGEPIKARAVIADTEPAGRTAGTLHFEIRKDGEPVDPAGVIGR